MRIMRAALLGLTFAVPLATGPALAQPSQQGPGILDQARRMLGGTDDQEAQRRAYEAGRRDEQQRQLDRDRERRTGDYDPRRGYGDRRGGDDRRGPYGSGDNPAGRPGPGYGGGQYGDRAPGGSPYERDRPTYDRNHSGGEPAPGYR